MTGFVRRMNVAILTVSDRGARGERDDLSGSALAEWLAARGVSRDLYGVVPDDVDMIASRLVEWADSGAVDLILTTGGTGLSPRDVTPDATMGVIHRLVPGFAELMRLRSLEKTTMAVLSRAVAGIRGAVLIVNLPGSPRGAVENLEALWPALPHAIDKIRGDGQDCAGIGDCGADSNEGS